MFTQFHQNTNSIVFLSYSYEGKKNTRLPKEHAERLGLQRKFKREFKSTVRTLRLDNEFLAREDLKQQMAKFVNE